MPTSAHAADDVIDTSFSEWPSRAAALLREQGFARLRLAPDDAERSRKLLCDADGFFNDPAGVRDMHIAPGERDARDTRSGYVFERGREYLELHPRTRSLRPTSAAAAVLLRTATAFSSACHELCERALVALQCDDGRLESLVRMEQSLAGAGDASFGASMLRVHRYTEGADYPPHVDLGLLTLAPRASVPGLVVQLPDGSWVALEELMAEDEAVIFAGSTLAELCAVRALPHRVGHHRDGSRVSAPYFLRASPGVPLPCASADGADEATTGDRPVGRSVGAFVAALAQERHTDRERSAALWSAPPPATVQVLDSSCVAEEAEVLAIATPVAPAEVLAEATPLPLRKSAAPARVKALWRRLDSDRDGRVTLAELCAGLEAEFGDGLPAHARAAIAEVGEALAIGDPGFGERYVDRHRFAQIYAEVLFRRFDAADAGVLTYDGAQGALKFLTRAPEGGGPKPDVPFAAPPDAYDEFGELRMPIEWFGMLFRTME